MLVLGIESSCDETAAAVIRDSTEVISNVIASQHDIHRQFGGVVPELASRRHVENMPLIVAEALERANVPLRDIDLFAVTQGPGLLGALLVGLSAAKGMAWTLKKPLVPVHHLHGHIVAANFEHQLVYPHLCLLVSGGHTSLFRVEGPTAIKELASTRDDAAGEAYDKVAKMLGLGFPGGPAGERAAKEGDENAVPFTIPRIKGSALDFSFSGLKTAVREAMKKNPRPADLAASFQKVVTDTLVARTLAAAEMFDLEEIVIAGGVAANRHLREGMTLAGAARGLRVVWPSPVFCTDNAAMIAAAGYYRFMENPEDPRWMDFIALDAVANLPML